MGAPAFEEDIVEFTDSTSVSADEKHSFKVKSKSHWVMTQEFLSQNKKVEIDIVWNPFYKHTKANLTATDILKEAGLLKLSDEALPGESNLFGISTEVVEATPTQNMRLLFRPLTSIKSQIYVGSLDFEEDQVIVKASSKKKIRRENPTIILGQDFTEGCSKVAFERESKTLNFYCSK